MAGSSPPVPPTTITFAVVPFVRTQKTINLGPWRLWPNTPDDWVQQTNMDLTWFTMMYRDRNGLAVGANGSVLTRTDGAIVARERFRDPIVAFSTLAWLDGNPGADCWLFEVWSVPSNVSPSDGIRRQGKFSVNYTNPSVERVMPSPYVYPITLRADLPDSMTEFVKNELVKESEFSFLRALGQVHEVRFETPYFTSLGNDLEALWTGFESLFLPKASAQPSTKALFPSPNPRRSDRVALAIREQLKDVQGIRGESLAAIDSVLSKLWEARNAHSHGGDAEPSAHIDALKTSALSAGLRLFETLLRIRIAVAAGDDVFFLPSAVEHLNEIFLREQTISGVVKALGKLKAADWYPPELERRDELERLKPLLLDLVNFERIEGWAAERDVAKARGFTRRVLNAWLKNLAKLGVHGGDVDNLTSFAAADATTLQNLKASGLTGMALEDALDNDLVMHAKSSNVWRALALDMKNAAPRLGGVIPLWLWVRSYIRLQELFLGYKLI